MTSLEALEALEARLHNVELAITALVSLTDDTLPSAYSDAVNTMIEEFYDSSKSLGGFKGLEFKERL